MCISRPTSSYHLSASFTLPSSTTPRSSTNHTLKLKLGPQDCRGARDRSSMLSFFSSSQSLLIVRWTVGRSWNTLGLPTIGSIPPYSLVHNVLIHWFSLRTRFTTTDVLTYLNVLEGYWLPLHFVLEREGLWLRVVGQTTGTEREESQRLHTSTNPSINHHCRGHSH